MDIVDSSGINKTETIISSTTLRDKSKKKISINEDAYTLTPPGSFKLYCTLSETADQIMMIFAILGSLGAGISNPLFAYFLGNVLNGITPKNTLSQLIASLSILTNNFLFVGAGMFVANLLANCLWLIIGRRTAYKLKEKYFSLIMSQDQKFFDKHNPFELSSKMQLQIKIIEAGLGDKLGNIFSNLSLFISGLIISFYASWKITLVLLSVFPLLVVSMAISNKSNIEAANNIQKSYEKAGSIAEEVIYAIKTICSFGNFTFEMSRFREQVSNAKDIGMKKNLIGSISGALIFFFLFSMNSLGLWYAAMLISDKSINSNTGKLFSAGDLVVCLISIRMASSGLSGFGPASKALSEACFASLDFFYFLNNKKNDETNPNSDKITMKKDTMNLNGNLCFKSVNFSYTLGKESLKDITMEMKPGKKIAIIGESGSGKTTIFNILERFYESYTGEITLDDVEIRKIRPIEEYRKLIGYVQQEPILFNTSIKRNIIFGRDYLNITDQQIEDACKLAYADQFINLKENKYDYIVGTKGSKLSVGEKQRIAIARAIIGKPKILILDEPTSALDNESEKLISDAIDNITRSNNIITILISHKLEIIRNSDIIYLIKEGQIVEYGNHEELNSQNGYYCKLIQSQTSQFHHININENDNLKSSEIIIETINDRLPSNANLISNNNDISLKDKNEDCKKVDNIINNQDKLWSLLSKNKCTVILSIFSCLVNGSVSPIFGLLLGYGITYLSDPRPDQVTYGGNLISLFFLILAIVTAIFSFLQNLKFAEVGEILSYKLRLLIYKKYLGLNMSFYDKKENYPGKLLARLSTETTQLNGVILSIIMVVIQTLANFSIGIAMGFNNDYRLALIIIAFMPFIILLGYITFKMRIGLINRDEESDAIALGLVSQTFVGSKSIISYNAQSKVNNIYLEILAGEKNAEMYRKALLMGIFYGIAQFAAFATYATVFYVGGTFIINGTLTYGIMLKAIFPVLFAAFGISSALQYIGDYSKTKIAVEDIFNLLSEKSSDFQFEDEILEIENPKSTITEPLNLKGKIEFKNVSFDYHLTSQSYSIKNVSFTVLPGQVVAFVGSSGCGKSTILQLIERFYDFQQGQIFIDDKEIDTYDPIQLRSEISVVLQEPVIFKRTIKENILYGNLQASDNEIIEVTNQAGLSNYFKDGNDEKVDAFNVSGGEKQRIAIARAMLKKSKIILLDEPTSSLDLEKEREVIQNLIKFIKENKKTCIIIAHRLNTIEFCDVIHCMYKGQIVESGSHSDLMKIKGKYFELSNI